MENLKDRDNLLLKNIVVFPLIFSIFLPIVILDFWIELYHRTCFPICKVSVVKRKDYIKFDRFKLSYLNQRQKVYCAYCSYVNGVFNYWVEIAGKTESYWCGIRHEEKEGFKEPKYHKNFAKYNDEKNFKEKYCKLANK